MSLYRQTEKIAFVGRTILGGAIGSLAGSKSDDPALGTVTGAAVGAGAGALGPSVLRVLEKARVGEGVAKGVAFTGKTIANNPGKAMTASGIGGVVAPTVINMTGPEAYRRRMQYPQGNLTDPEYYAMPDSARYMETKYAGDTMRPSLLLEKVASIRGTADAFGRKLGVGTAEFLPRLIAMGTVGALANHVATPIAKSVGEDLQSRFVSPEKRIGADLIEAKMRFEDQTRNNLANEKQQAREAANQPVFHSVFQDLTQRDPLLMAARQDPELHRVMQQTAQSIYSFAPDLAKDPRALQSLLTEAVTSPEGGLSFQTIRSLADTQKTINDSRG